MEGIFELSILISLNFESLLEKAFDNVVCKTETILTLRHCINTL